MRAVHMRRSFRLAGCLVGLMAASAAGAADKPADPKPESSKQAPGGAKPNQSGANRGIEVRLRRLESVTWNPVTQELTWVLSSGDLDSSGYAPSKQESYVIRMDAALMKVEGEDRHFDPDEAEQVGKLMDLICRYALESTIWWEHGGGTKQDGSTPDGKGTAPGNPTTDPPSKDKNDTNKYRKVPPGMLRGATPPPTPLPPAANTVAAARH